MKSSRGVLRNARTDLLPMAMFSYASVSLSFSLRPTTAHPTALLVFNLGWIACIIIWIFVMGGDANTFVNADA